MRLVVFVPSINAIAIAFSHNIYYVVEQDLKPDIEIPRHTMILLTRNLKHNQTLSNNVFKKV